MKTEFSKKKIRDDIRRRNIVLKNSYAQVLKRHSNEQNVRRLFARDHQVS